ncbi:ABC transporter ATP-binding protein [Actinomadura verrucosospora]|uniref:ABC transporter ATP-binding protein n=1 Tax=Actinomadura verrucosospora TaxID=46165 RepID=A0A7D3VP73_ACTVE|nr:ABC transporter ATP-binding protein [Actinomadura verrucosospora]QKG19160.1 ABC transporter ATP-binding protein [Actinomadura verrucosospora]
MSLNESAVVSLSGVHKRYGSGGNQVTALDGVDLSFLAGTFTAVMGPSGSGKSTLLQCAAGLDRVDGGQVLLAGADPARMSETALTVLRREKVGFVFQQFNLLPSLTARQNIELPLRLAGRPPRPEDVDRVLADVGLGDRARHLPSELSGGQQQRVAIARALVTSPDVLFADEPTGALDSRTSRDVLALMRRVAAERGQTIIMVTHDPVAASYAGRAVFLAHGRIVDEVARPTAESVAAHMARLEATGC